MVKCGECPLRSSLVQSTDWRGGRIVAGCTEWQTLHTEVVVEIVWGSREGRGGWREESECGTTPVAVGLLINTAVEPGTTGRTGGREGGILVILPLREARRDYVHPQTGQ